MSSYHYSFYSPRGLHCLGFLPQISLLAEDILPRISQIYTELLAEYILPQISQIYTEVRLPSRGCTCLKCTNQANSAPTKQNRYSPTESTEPTELLAECIPPQISQIYTELLVECVLPQISQNPQNCLLSVFSHSRRFCEFRVFCGRPLTGVVAAEAGIPPLQASYSK